jgi:hypothetical protein
MSRLYYINNNRSKPYSIQEIEEKIILHDDDLVWHDELTDWIRADQLEELKQLTRKRPPLSRKKKLALAIKKASIKSVSIYLMFCVSVGVLSGLIEKYQFQTFWTEIDKNYQEHKREELRREKINRERIDKLEAKKNARLQDILKSIDKKTKLSEQNNEIVRRAFDSYFDNVELIDEKDQENIRLRNEIETLYKNYYALLDAKSEGEINRTMYSSFEGFGNFNDSKKNKSETIGIVSFDIPLNIIYKRRDNGSYYTRWCVYSSNPSNNENSSYENCGKFFMRPYYALFDVANLSNEEQQNIILLLFNFILSSLVSNSPIFIILFFFFYKAERNKLV